MSSIDFASASFFAASLVRAFLRFSSAVRLRLTMAKNNHCLSFKKSKSLSYLIPIDIQIDNQHSLTIALYF